jgi:catechol 2,3-dioxygenase-like lactoylglutathione lyase family enzyme
MPLRNLNHVLVLAEDLEATRDFYTEVLGLEMGERPPFGFPGYWLYLSDQAVIHLASKDPEDAGEGPGESAIAAGTGPIDHIAFEATGLADMMTRLEAHGIPVRQREVLGLGRRQLFIRDPNGVTIELNYPASEA